MPSVLPLTARAQAHANIALAKYWGKSPRGDNLTAVPSLSMTLDALTTRTSVTFSAELRGDELELNGRTLDEKGLARVSELLDRVRTITGVKLPARVVSYNNFPTAAGLASSASGFAALAVAALAATSALDAKLASRLARQSSASAARSLYGGFVELASEAESATPVADAGHFDVAMLVAVVEDAKKPISSTLGMEHTRATSPLYRGWVESASATFEQARRAVLERDFLALAEAMEHSTLAMHATMMSARPPVLYLRGPSVELMHAIMARRREGHPEAFTLDAGPNVKVLVPRAHVESTRSFLADFPGVTSVIVAYPGPGATLLAPDGELQSAAPLSDWTPGGPV